MGDGLDPQPSLPKPIPHPVTIATAPACCSTGPSSQALSLLPAAPLLPQYLSPQALSLLSNSLPCPLLSIPIALSSPTLTPAFSLASQPPISSSVLHSHGYRANPGPPLLIILPWLPSTPRTKPTPPQPGPVLNRCSWMDGWMGGNPQSPHQDFLSVLILITSVHTLKIFPFFSSNTNPPSVFPGPSPSKSASS